MFTKTKNKKTSIGFASLLTFSVLVSSVHLKDLVSHESAKAFEQSGSKNVVAKANEGLHNHVDKQFVKTFIKTDSGDNIIAPRNRHELPKSHVDDPSLARRIGEELLIWVAYLSLAFRV